MIRDDTITAIVYSIESFEVIGFKVADSIAYNSILASSAKVFDIVEIVVLKTSSKDLIKVNTLRAYRNVLNSFLYSYIRSIE